MTPLRELFDEVADEVLLLYRWYRSRLESLSVTRKTDSTLLTEADLAIQRAVVRRLRSGSPGAGVIAEERGEKDRNPARSSGDFWIIDPIDGTKEFVREDGFEFCTVVAWVESYRPSAALLIAPELGKDKRPFVFSAFLPEKKLFVNKDAIAVDPRRNSPPTLISATRSSGAKTRPFEQLAGREGIALKTRTTSQSLDMLRLVVDLPGVTGRPLPMFDLFFREHQKLWDGVAGLVFASIAGFVATDRAGGAILPFDRGLLSHPIPESESVVVGPPANVAWFQRLLARAGKN